MPPTRAIGGLLTSLNRPQVPKPTFYQKKSSHSRAPKLLTEAQIRREGQMQLDIKSLYPKEASHAGPKSCQKPKGPATKDHIPSL